MRHPGLKVMHSEKRLGTTAELNFLVSFIRLRVIYASSFVYYFKMKFHPNQTGYSNNIPQEHQKLK